MSFKRTEFQNEILAPVSESEAFEELIRLRSSRSEHKKPIASFLWPMRMAIDAGRQSSLKSEKIQKNLVKHLFQFLS